MAEPEKSTPERFSCLTASGRPTPDCARTAFSRSRIGSLLVPSGATKTATRQVLGFSRKATIMLSQFSEQSGGARNCSRVGQLHAFARFNLVALGCSTSAAAPVHQLKSTSRFCDYRCSDQRRNDLPASSGRDENSSCRGVRRSRASPTRQPSRASRRVNPCQRPDKVRRIVPLQAVRERLWRIAPAPADLVSHPQ